MIYLKTSIGIEIREEDLLISCLRSNFSGGVFTQFRRIPSFRQRDAAEVRKEIDEFFKEGGLSRENVTLGIPRNDAIVRHLDLPAEVADNLREVVQYQVQSYEPTEEEKFCFDYELLGSSEDKKRLQVLLVMVRKSVLEEHLKILRELGGIEPVAMTVGSVALANLFLQHRGDAKGKTYVLADLKQKSAEIVALRNGAFLLSHESVRAEGKSWKEFLLAELALASSKIRLKPDDVIEKIVLTGEDSESALQELREELTDLELAGTHLRLEMPLQNRRHLPAATVSIGLAHSGLVRRRILELNLLPPELRVQQARWVYVPSLLLASCFVLLLLGLLFRPMIQERILARSLDQEINSLKPRVTRVQRIGSEVEGLEKKIAYVEGLFREADLNLEILQELTTTLPQDTFLNVYQNRGGTIQISGSSGSAPDLIPKLEKSPLLKDVQQRGTIFKDAQTGKDRFNFEAKLER